MIKPRNLKANFYFSESKNRIKHKVPSMMFYHSLPVSHHTTYGPIVYRLKKNPCSDVKTRCFLHFQMAGWLPIFTISYSCAKKKVCYHDFLCLDITLVMAINLRPDRNELCSMTRGKPLGKTAFCQGEE